MQEETGMTCLLWVLSILSRRLGALQLPCRVPVINTAAWMPVNIVGVKTMWTYITSSRRRLFKATRVVTVCWSHLMRDYCINIDWLLGAICAGNMPGQRESLS